MRKMADAVHGKGTHWTCAQNKIVFQLLYLLLGTDTHDNSQELIPIYSFRWFNMVQTSNDCMWLCNLKTISHRLYDGSLQFGNIITVVDTLSFNSTFSAPDNTTPFTEQ